MILERKASIKQKNKNTSHMNEQQFKQTLKELENNKFGDQSVLIIIKTLDLILDSLHPLTSNSVKMIWQCMTKAIVKSCYPKIESFSLQNVYSIIQQPRTALNCPKQQIKQLWNKLINVSNYQSIRLIACCLWLFLPIFQSEYIQKTIFFFILQNRYMKDRKQDQIQLVIIVLNTIYIQLKKQQIIKECKFITLTNINIITLMIFLSKKQIPNEKYKNLMYQIIQQIENKKIIQKINIQPIYLLNQQMQQNIKFLRASIYYSLFSVILNFIDLKITQILIKMIQKCINFQMTIIKCRYLISRLQITNQYKILQKWQIIFKLMSFCIKKCLKKKKFFFKQNFSYVIFRLNEQRLPLKLNFHISLYFERKNQQKILFKFKLNLQAQVQLTIINTQFNSVILSLLKLQNNIIWEKQKVECKWDEFEFKKFQINISSQVIQVIIQNQNSEVQSIFSITHTPITTKKELKSIQYFVIGDQSKKYGGCINWVQQLVVSNKQGKIYDILNFQANTNQNNLYLYKCVISRQQSFLTYAQKLGHLDLFFLLTSHAIKRIKDDSILEIIGYTVNTLKQFAIAKGVAYKQLDPQDKENRLNSIIFLSWIASKNTYSSGIIFKLTDFLKIRGLNNSEDLLQVFCNFVFWQKYSWQYQKLILHRIRQIFLEIYSIAEKRDLTKKIIIKFSKRISLEMTLFYRQSFDIDAEKKQLCLKMRAQFCSMLVSSFKNIIQKNSYPKNTLIEISYFYIKLICCCCLDQIFPQYDIGLAVQLSSIILQVIIFYDSYQFDLCPLFHGHKLEDQNIPQQLYEENEDESMMEYMIKIIQQLSKIFDTQSQLSKEPVKIYKKNAYDAFDAIMVNQQNLYQNIGDFYAYLLSLGKNNKEKWIYKYLSPENQWYFIQGIWKVQFLRKMERNSSKITDQIINFMWKECSISGMHIDLFYCILKCYIKKDELLLGLSQQISNYIKEKIKISDFIEFISQIEKSIVKIENNLDSQETQSSNVFALQTYKYQYKRRVSKVISILNNIQNVSFEQYSSIISLLTSNNKQYYKFLINLYILQIIIKENSLFATQQKEIPPIQMVKNCFFFYHKSLNTQNMMIFMKQITNSQAKDHVENYQINTQAIIQLVKNQNKDQMKFNMFIGFIRTHLFSFAQFLIVKEGFNKFQKQQTKHLKRRKALKFSFNSINLSSKAQQMYYQFYNERKQTLAKLERVWQQVRFKNRYYWSVFITNQRNYSLNSICSKTKAKKLLKVDTSKPKLQLPSMKREGSILTATILTDIQDIDEGTEYSMQSLYRTNTKSDDSKDDKMKNTENRSKKQKILKKNKQYQVLLIQSDTIYQGQLTLQKGKNCIRFLEAFIKQKKYEDICANRSQYRKDQQIQYNQLELYIQCNFDSFIVKKNYLFLKVALEIYSENRTYFFKFSSQEQRQKFYGELLNKTNIQNKSQKSYLQKLTQKWKWGLKSNFEYLMQLNDLASRSFNDLSQYYIFPWTVINFTANCINVEFLKNVNNFRRLSEPVGKMDDNRWKQIEQRYQISSQINQQSMVGQPFLYGSFYSNSVIVSSYLIRLNPFSTIHCQNYTDKFDVADRLFFSLQDQLKSCTRNMSDLRELIPEFYSFADFLKNNNRLNFGLRQNKDKVDNVVLPEWCNCANQFICKMRKILQHQIVSENLNGWIDLIFGVYNQKKYAKKKDNLFMTQFYENNNSIKSTDEMKKYQMLIHKQFGQTPKTIFKQKHPKFQLNISIFQQSIKNCYYFIVKFDKYKQHCKQIQIFKDEIFIFTKQVIYYYHELKQFLSIDNNFTTLNFQTQQNDQFMSLYQNSGSPKLSYIYIYLRNQQVIYGRLLKKSLFSRRWQMKQQFQFFHDADSRITSFKIMNNFLIILQNNCIKVRCFVLSKHYCYNYTLKTLQCDKGKQIFYYYDLDEFLQHKQKIQKINVYEDQNLIVSIDEQGQLFILHVNTKFITIVNQFKIKQLRCYQIVQQILFHGMGFIIIRTNRSRLLFYSCIGQLLGIFAIQTINYYISYIEIFSHQRSELLIGMNQGQLWKVDIFQLISHQKLSYIPLWIECMPQDKLLKNKIVNIVVERIGRFWRIFTINSEGILQCYPYTCFQKAKKKNRQLQQS